MKIEVLSLTISVLALTVSIIFSTLALRNRKETLVVKKDMLKITNATNKRSQLVYFKTTLNSLIDIAQEWYLLDLEKERDVHYDTKLGNLKMKRASLVESANQLANEVVDEISATEFSELAKSLYSVYDYENADKYHNLAISKGQGPLGIACKRSYADFLFCTGKIQQGRLHYENALVDEISDDDKEHNARTMKMWMHNEKSLGNESIALEKYEASKNVANRIGVTIKKQNMLTEIENAKKKLWI